jgi:PHD/YefM family antitoxin component YafN of YafNO toxin-antitoxin module
MYKNLRSLFRERLETPIMLDIKKLKIEYVTNREGEKTAVIVPIENFDELMEDIEDLAAVAERREEPTISHDQLVAELKRDGLI